MVYDITFISASSVVPCFLPASEQDVVVVQAHFKTEATEAVHPKIPLPSWDVGEISVNLTLYELTFPSSTFLHPIQTC